MMKLVSLVATTMMKVTIQLKQQWNEEEYQDNLLSNYSKWRNADTMVL